MAKATAVCTCKKCGETFTKTTTKNNRRDANAWEEWAVANYDLCPDCYKQEQREAEEAAGLIAEIRLDDTTALLKGKAEAVIVVVGCGHQYKDQLKGLGYRYTEDVPSAKAGLGGLLDDLLSAPKKYWAKRIAPDDFEAAANEIVALGGQCKAPSAYDLQMYGTVLREGKKHQAEKSAAAAEAEAKVAAALEALGPCPEYPEDVAAIINAGRWNGKVYGRKGNWSIYIGGNKQPLTDAQKEVLVATQEARQEWRAKKAAAEAEARA